MQHRGEILKKAIDESGMPKTRIHRLMGISRKTLYNKFSEPDVPLEFLMKMGRVIHHDFSHEIPELKKIDPIMNDSSANPVYYTDAEYWKNKYLALLEEYNALLKESKKGK